MRTPVKARLIRSLFPTDVISLITVRKAGVRDVTVTIESGNGLLKIVAGDRWDLGSLRRGQSVDFAVGTNTASSYGKPGDGIPYPVQLPNGRPIFLGMTWVADRMAGELLIAWSAEARARGERPLIAFGESSRGLRQYVQNARQPVDGDLLQFRRRVKPITRRDVKIRIKDSKETSAVMPDAGTHVWLTKLSTRGFRGFREDAELRLAIPNGEDGSGLTIVVGANNTGKSTLWESFDAMARKQKFDISFSEGRRNRGTPGGIRIAIERTDSRRFVVESQNANTSETRSFWEPTPPSDQLEIVSVPSRRQFQANFGKNVVPQRDWMTNGMDFSRFRQPDAQFTGRLFDLHSDPVKKAQFDSLMAEVLGYELTWTIDMAEGQSGFAYYLKVSTGQGVDHTSEGLGDGIVSLLYVLNALYDSEPSTLLVFDEPELSLHPQLIRRLGRVLARAAANRQVVIFTHSPALISWDDIENGAEIARTYKDEGDSKIAQASRKTIHEVAKARGGWRNPHVLGSDAKEAFFLDDEVIVVEGQEDAMLLPTVFDQLGLDRRGTVFGFGSGGGDGGPRRIVQLLHDLGFKKVVALLDADKEEQAKSIQLEFPDYLAITIPADDIRDKPATPAFEGKNGLMDEKGRSIKQQHEPAIRNTLASVLDFFASGDAQRRP